MSNKQNSISGRIIRKKCIICNKEFEVIYGWRHYKTCSAECKKKLLSLIGKEFYKNLEKARSYRVKRRIVKTSENCSRIVFQKVSYLPELIDNERFESNLNSIIKIHNILKTPHVS